MPAFAVSSCESQTIYSTAAAIVCNFEIFKWLGRHFTARNWCLETTCTVQLTAGKPRFRESKQLRALRRLGYLLKTYEENSFLRARSFTNLRQIGAFGNHLLQLATLRGRGRAKDRECPSVRQSECSRSEKTVRFIRVCVS